MILTANAQDPYYAPSNAKPVTGVVEPTIHGIPYSQYVAQEKASEQFKKTVPAPVVPDNFKLPADPPKWNPADKKTIPAGNVTKTHVMTTEEKLAMVKAGQVEMEKRSEIGRAHV